MIWRYTLTTREGVEYTINDEPVQWDTVGMTLQRDSETHGIIPAFGKNTLQFHDQAYFLLKEEYVLNGVDGYMAMAIEWKCEECPTFELFTQGTLDFASFNEHCGADCYCSMGYEEQNLYALLQNRKDIKVDLGATKCYDGITDLASYEGLGKTITVPSKALFLQSKATTKNDVDNTDYNILADADYIHYLPNFETGNYLHTNEGVILPKLNNTSISELADFTPQYQHDYIIDSDKYTDTQIQTINNDSGLVLTNNYNVNFRFKGSLYFKYSFGVGSGSPAPSGGSLDVKLGLSLQYGSGHTDAFAPIELEHFHDTTLTPLTIFEHTIAFDVSWNGTMVLNPLDKLWLFFPLKIIGSNQSVNDPLMEMKFSLTDDSFFFIDSASVVAASPAKVFLLHEAGARIVESITDNLLSFKSEHYGRTDSEPLAYDGDGCGSLRAFTNGLQLRRALLQDNSSPNPFTSWKEFYDAQNALDCIGAGIEGNYVRVEPVDYFYRKEVVFVADGVYEYDRDVRTNRIWNAFKFGFDKYETESTNGLDAIHTKREYRLPIINADQPLEQYCKYIYDGYAIEVTRRKYGSTEDWRYDQNVFGFCLKRGDDDVEVEQGNITGAANLFDPPTVINFRVSPLRNAMRWFRWIMQGIRVLTSSKQMLFNSGEGNYVARGELDSATCRMENGIVTENMPLSTNNFADPEAAIPFIVPETVVFEYPLGLNEFVGLKKNMYGLIQYRQQPTDAWQWGWIDRLEPDHEGGKAKFTLITALYDGPAVEDAVGLLATEDYIPITTETGEFIPVETGAYI